jgi:hypothetical protein
MARKGKKGPERSQLSKIVSSLVAHHRRNTGKFRLPGLVEGKIKEETVPYGKPRGGEREHARLIVREVERPGESVIADVHHVDRQGQERHVGSVRVMSEEPYVSSHEDFGVGKPVNDKRPKGRTVPRSELEAQIPTREHGRFITDYPDKEGHTPGNMPRDLRLPRKLTSSLTNTVMFFPENGRHAVHLGADKIGYVRRTSDGWVFESS